MFAGNLKTGYCNNISKYVYIHLIFKQNLIKLNPHPSETLLLQKKRSMGITCRGLLGVNGTSEYRVAVRMLSGVLHLVWSALSMWCPINSKIIFVSACRVLYCSLKKHRIPRPCHLDWRVKGIASVFLMHRCSIGDLPVARFWLIRLLQYVATVIAYYVNSTDKLSRILNISHLVMQTNLSQATAGNFNYLEVLPIKRC